LVEEVSVEEITELHEDLAEAKGVMATGGHVLLELDRCILRQDNIDLNLLVSSLEEPLRH
jgi:hypothetical protein